MSALVAVVAEKNAAAFRLAYSVGWFV